MEPKSKLFEALAKAQAEIKPAVLDMVNPHYKSRYASLTSVQEAYKEALAKHSLSVVQIVRSGEGHYYLDTMLCHSSGESISSAVRLLITKQDMQGLGSAITYARRYAVSAMLGIVDTEDDDGNASIDVDKSKKVEGSAKRESPVQQRALSDAQLKRLYAIAKGGGWGVNEARGYIEGVYEKSPGSLTRAEYDEACQHFMTTKFKPVAPSMPDMPPHMLDDEIPF